MSNIIGGEAVAIDPSSGNVYITDTGNNWTIKLDKDLNFILDWGSLGTDEGKFKNPHGIGVDSSGKPKAATYRYKNKS